MYGKFDFQVQIDRSWMYHFYSKLELWSEMILLFHKTYTFTSWKFIITYFNTIYVPLAFKKHSTIQEL